MLWCGQHSLSLKAPVLRGCGHAWQDLPPILASHTLAHVHIPNHIAFALLLFQSLVGDVDHITHPVSQILQGTTKASSLQGACPTRGSPVDSNPCCFRCCWWLPFQAVLHTKAASLRFRMTCSRCVLHDNHKHRDIPSKL